MSNVTRFQPSNSPVSLTPAQIALARRTVAADANDDEFSLFIHTAQHLRLDPLRRQVYCFVFSKNDPKKRRMSIVTSIDGFRSIAARSGDYRPDEEEPTYETDPALKGLTNPVGLVKATVRCWKFAHGGWHKVTASAYWDEAAPLKEEWAEDETGRRRPTGKMTLDTSGNWAKMPRLMLAKVAEALCLRKGWPDDFANVYAHEEVDKARFEDLTPAEIAAEAASEERLQRIGGIHTILIDWMDDQPLCAVPVGQVADRVMDFIRQNREEPSVIAQWQIKNTHSLREFWARSPSDALEVKKAIEAASAEIQSMTAAQRAEAERSTILAG